MIHMEAEKKETAGIEKEERREVELRIREEQIIHELGKMDAMAPYKHAPKSRITWNAFRVHRADLEDNLQQVQDEIAFLIS